MVQGSRNDDVKTETRRKRSQLDVGAAGGVFGIGGYKDINGILEELGDNALLQSSLMPPSVADSFDADNLSPLVYYMLLQKYKQCKLKGTSFFWNR